MPETTETAEMIQEPQAVANGYIELRAARDRLEALIVPGLAPWRARHIGVCYERVETAMSAISSALIAIQVHAESEGAREALQASQ